MTKLAALGHFDTSYRSYQCMKSIAYCQIWMLDPFNIERIRTRHCQLVYYALTRNAFNKTDRWERRTVLGDFSLSILNILHRLADGGIASPLLILQVHPSDVFFACKIRRLDNRLVMPLSNKVVFSFKCGCILISYWIAFENFASSLATHVCPTASIDTATLFICRLLFTSIEPRR